MYKKLGVVMIVGVAICFAPEQKKQEQLREELELLHVHRNQVLVDKLALIQKIEKHCKNNGNNQLFLDLLNQEKSIILQSLIKSKL